MVGYDTEDLGGTATVEASVTRYDWDHRNGLVAVREYASAESEPLPAAFALDGE